MKMFIYVIAALFYLCGCTSTKPVEPPPPPRPYNAGIIRQVNQAEHYFVFESGKILPENTELTLLRKGRIIGKARVNPIQDKKLQTADILRGAPLPGDLCEPEISSLPQILEPQSSQQGQRRSFRP
ncbi:hypothetical protein P0Y35_01025 [Kiritimatiellaeota bacterium B1221]|nr:hypothetical protein [Kiritimatiellaeota bacterium B1221]